MSGDTARARFAPGWGGEAKGPGWGGPAKGGGDRPAKPWTAEAPGLAVIDVHDPDELAFRRSQRALARERRRKAWEAIDRLVADAEHVRHFDAVRDALNRLEGTPVQRVEQTGANGGPIQVEDARRPPVTFLGEFIEVEPEGENARLRQD